MKQKTFFIILAVVFVVMIACCIGITIYGLMADPGFSLSNTPQQLAALPELEAALAVEFPSPSIKVDIGNGHVIRVNFFNSQYYNLPDETARQKKAREIAFFISENYGSMDTIDTITIKFTERISMGLNLDKFFSYVFYVNDLK